MKFNPESPEFKKIIREEAARFKKRIMLENEKKILTQAINEMDRRAEKAAFHDMKHDGMEVTPVGKSTFDKEMTPEDFERLVMDFEKMDENKSGVDENGKMCQEEVLSEVGEVGGNINNLQKVYNDFLTKYVNGAWKGKGYMGLTPEEYAAQAAIAAQDKAAGAWGVDPTTKKMIYRPYNKLNMRRGGGDGDSFGNKM